LKKLISYRPFKTVKYIFILLSALSLFSNCKPKADTRPYGPQYEEDPGPERGTTKERLQGSWRIEDYLLNGNSVYNELNAVAKGSINLDTVYFSYSQATKDNGWYEKRVIEPWPCTFDLNQNAFSFSSATYDSTFTYWFLNPFVKTNNSPVTSWKITKLYQGSFYITLSTTKGNFKIKWKR